MSAALLDRPNELELDLRELDFAARRRRLFTALHDLRAGEELRLTGLRTSELYWLRYEMEARLDHRFCWSSAGEGPGSAGHTVVHLCPSETAPRPAPSATATVTRAAVRPAGTSSWCPRAGGTDRSRSPLPPG